MQIFYHIAGTQIKKSKNRMIYVIENEQIFQISYKMIQGSSVSSIGKNINTRPAKVWTAIDRLSFIWKSDLKIN